MFRSGSLRLSCASLPPGTRFGHRPFCGKIARHAGPRRRMRGEKRTEGAAEALRRRCRGAAEALPRRCGGAAVPRWPKACHKPALGKRGTSAAQGSPTQPHTSPERAAQTRRTDLRPLFRPHRRPRAALSLPKWPNAVHPPCRPPQKKDRRSVSDGLSVEKRMVSRWVDQVT